MKSLIGFILLMVSTTLCAAEAQRANLTITGINVISTGRPAQPTAQGLTRVYFESGAWGATDCRDNAADIVIEDKHLYSAVLAAFTSKITIDVKVDSSIKPHDQVCKMILVTLSN